MYLHIFLVILTTVQCDPIIIKTGIAKDHAQQQGDDVFTVQGKKGISSFISDLGFNKDNEGKYISAADSGRFNQENSDRKQHLDEKDFNNESFEKNAGGLQESIDQKAGHKKGHHKSGFKNTYHKEESGSKSNFYEDSDDQGGKHIQNSRQGIYSNDASNKNRQAHHDGTRYINDNTRNGYYDNKGLYEKGHGNQRNYNQQNYNDDRLLKSHSNTGNRFGETGKFVQENYKKPYYHHDDYYYPDYGQHVPPKRTITVYEDPRYEDEYSRYDYPEYERYDDPVRLEIRPPLPGRRHREGLLYDQDYY